jgi:hypothetical protein
MLTDVMSDRFLVRDARSAPDVHDRLLGIAPQVPGGEGTFCSQARYRQEQLHVTALVHPVDEGQPVVP